MGKEIGSKPGAERDALSEEKTVATMGSAVNPPNNDVVGNLELHGQW